MKCLIHVYLPQHLAAIDAVLVELVKRGHELVYTDWSPDNHESGNNKSWAPRWNHKDPPKADCTILACGPVAGEVLPRPMILLPHGSGVFTFNGVTAPVHPDCELGLVQGSVHEQQFLSVLNHQDYKVTGWAKTDELLRLDPAITKQQIIQEFKLDPSKKIVMFSPTYNVPIWKPAPNAAGHLARKVYEALGDKYNLLFCPHELDNWKEDTKGLPNVIRMSNKNRLLVAADMMVGDRSSIMSEFLVLGKPQVHLWNTADRDDIVPHLWGKKENEKVGFGPRTSVLNLAEVVESLFADPTLFAQERAYWKDRIFYKPDGHAAERVVDAIEDYKKCR